MTKRTGFALGVAIPVVIIVVIVLFTTGGSGSQAKKRPPRPAKLPPLSQAYTSSSIGVVGLLPADWTARRGSGFVRLGSRDGGALIVIAAESNHSGTHALLLAALKTLTKHRPEIKLKLGRGTKLGGLPANSRVIYTRDARGTPIRILVAGARGKHLGYVVEAITLRNASVHDLVEAQQVVLTLRLTG
ncbi:MAG: hypothetical protein ACR2OB_10930 [Solirubrobacteraceae bacterium]